MSDHDRGAYTPQTDEPLAFDPRTPSERRPVPMTLIASALVLVLLIGGVALVYRGGVRGAGEAPRPVGQPIMAVKTAPAPEAQPVPPKSDADLDAVGKPASVDANQTGPAPNFTATAEQPAARPKPQPKTVAALQPPPAEKPAAPIAAPTHRTASTASPSGPFPPSSASSGLDASEVAAAGMTSQAPAGTGSVKLAQSAPVKSRRAVAAAAEEDEAGDAAPKAAPAVKPDAAGKTGPAVVQIGAFSSSALADKGYSDVSSNMAAQMSGKSKHVLPIDKDGKTLYRTWVAGFASRGEAVAFCEALRTKNKTCIVKS